MKKIFLSVFIISMLAFASLTVCFASEGSGSKVAKADGNGNITVTRTLSEKDIIEDLNSKSMAKLRRMGYSIKQIHNIRIMDGDHPSRNYGTLTYTVTSYKDGFYYKDGKTYLKTKLSWSWSQTPVFVLTDYPAITTSEHFAKYGSNNKASVYYYKNGVKRSDYKKTRSTGIVADSYGNYLEVQMKKKIDGDTYYALGGDMITYWRTSGSIKCVGIYGNYGHKILSGTVSVGFGGKAGSISFTPEYRIEHGLSADINVER